jgi:membrane protein
MKTFRAIWGLLKESFSGWSEDKAPRLGAALAYYTIFSLAPLLVIVIGVAAFVFGREAAQGEVLGQLQGLLGEAGAQAIQGMIQNASQSKTTGAFATVIGVATLLFGASGVFGELQDALNTVWGVKPKPGRGILGTIKQRFLSFAMVAGIAFLLLVSLTVSAALAAVGKFTEGLLPTEILHVVNFVTSFAVITLLFAMIYKLLPDARIAWSDVWIGAAVTALLFTIGKFAIGLYLGKSSVASAYGAAGSLVILLVWIYYSAQILFFGAEFTEVYARRYGSGFKVAPDAVPVTQEAREQQGLVPPEKAAASSTAPARLAPYTVAAGAAAVGFVIGRMPLLRALRTRPKETAETAGEVLKAIAGVSRLLNERYEHWSDHRSEPSTGSEPRRSDTAKRAA